MTGKRTGDGRRESQRLTGAAAVYLVGIFVAREPLCVRTGSALHTRKPRHIERAAHAKSAPP